MTNPITGTILEVKKEHLSSNYGGHTVTEFKARTIDGVITGDLLSQGFVLLPQGEYDDNHLLQAVHQLTKGLQDNMDEVARLTELNNGHIRDCNALKAKLVQDTAVASEGVLRENAELKERRRADKEALNEIIEALRKERDSLREALSARDSRSYHEICEQNDKLRSMLSAKETENNDLGIENGKLRRWLENTQQELTLFKKNLSACQEEKSSLKADLLHARAAGQDKSYYELSTEITKLRQHLSEEQSARHAKNTLIEKLQNKLNKLQSVITENLG